MATLSASKSQMSINEHTVGWLLESENPSVRYFTLKELRGEPEGSRTLAEERRKTPEGSLAKSLFSGLQPDGGFNVHPYTKWTGAHWRLVSLAALGIPPGHPGAIRMANQVLDWLSSAKHRDPIKRTEGRVRAHASMEGNALAACSRLGLTKDARVKSLADSLVDWQWPDGGWNCDPKPEATHSSFNESLIPLRGLIEYETASGDNQCRKNIERALEFFLHHKLFRSDTDGRVINNEWLELRYPAYWHYGILEALITISKAGLAKDARTREALDIVAMKRGKDGKWAPEGYYWLPPGERAKEVQFTEDYSEPPMPEAVNWGREGPNEILTLNAAIVLNAAGRLDQQIAPKKT